LCRANIVDRALKEYHREMVIGDSKCQIQQDTCQNGQ
jgi:hypothetical protein